MYNYSRNHINFIRTAARTAAGASDPSRKRLPPRAVFINEVNKNQMYSMCQLCFDNHFQLTQHDNGRFISFAELLLSYLFIMLEKWVTDYGRENITVKKIVENALHVKLVIEELDGSVNLSCLYEYGALALHDMKARNSLSQVLTSHEPVQQLLELSYAQQAESLLQRQMILTLTAQCQTMEKTITEFKRKMDALSTSMVDMRGILSTSSPQSRKKPSQSGDKVSSSSLASSCPLLELSTTSSTSANAETEISQSQLRLQ